MCKDKVFTCSSAYRGDKGRENRTKGLKPTYNRYVREIVCEEERERGGEV